MASATRLEIRARSSIRTMAKESGLKGRLRAFWEERALPSGVLGPVDCWAFAWLAATRLGEVGIGQGGACGRGGGAGGGCKGVRMKGRFFKILVTCLRSEEHTSE